MAYKITFTDTTDQIHSDFHPITAAAGLPDWFRKLQPYHNGEKYYDIRTTNDQSTGTIKRCLPVFDAMTSGYLLRLHTDLMVRNEDGVQFYQWREDPGVAFQAHWQAPNYPGQENRKNDYPKIVNPWVVSTPPGVSCLFLAPVHHDLPFRILEGIVDTDTYNQPVQFPFVLKNEEFDGLIPAGTPVAQVIPFKRHAWEMEIDQSEKRLRKARQVGHRIRATFINGYRSSFWHRKEYR